MRRPCNRCGKEFDPMDSYEVWVGRELPSTICPKCEAVDREILVMTILHRGNGERKDQTRTMEGI